jgi:hypothetical protein
MGKMMSSPSCPTGAAAPHVQSEKALTYGFHIPFISQDFPFGKDC